MHIRPARETRSRYISCMASPGPQPRASCAQAVAEDESPRDRGQVPSATDNQPRSAEGDYDFVERPSQDFFCPVSLELLLEPQLTSCCGHHLSREAATNLQREGKACPMCNEQEWNSMLDKFHRRKVHEVRIRCPRNGCDWVGEVNGLKGHTNSCVKRLWECKYCGLKCTYGEGEGKHWPTCRKFPEPCPNGCEVGSVERCKEEQHRSVCSLEPVACEMKEFGCSVVVPRKELATHMRESELQHLTAMAVLNLRLSRQLQQDSMERDEKIAQLQQDMAEQKQMQNEMKQLQNEMKTKMDGQKRVVVELKAQVQAVQHITQRIEQRIAGGACSVCKVFTFTNYGQCRCSGTERYSDLFYSHHHGYKFKLGIFYYKSDIGAWLYLVTGEYDDQLHWPVEVKVRLELLNQAGAHCHVERTASYKLKKNEMNICWDIDNGLMQYSDLERKGDGVQYMMNDSLKFRVHLTALPA